MHGGEMPWRLSALAVVVALTAAGAASAQQCSTNCLQNHAVKGCTEPDLTCGCEDPICSEAVCAQIPDCCYIEWDDFCVALALKSCNYYNYDCPVGDYPVNNCPTGATVIFPGDAVAFNSTAATTVGPDEPECGSSEADIPIWRDLWYRYDAPADLPEGSIMTASNCNTANFDSKIAAYNIGDGNYEPCTLPDLFIACNEDGPNCAEFTSLLQFSVSAGNSYLIRMGGYLDAAGEGTISFILGDPPPPLPPTIFTTGGTKSIVNDSTGALTNLGLSSGYLNGNFPQRWLAQPFTLPVPASLGEPLPWNIQAITANGFCPGGVCAELLNYIIWSRTDLVKPVDGDQILSGSVAFPAPDDDPDGDPTNERFRIDTDFELAAGDYYLTVYASNKAPDTVANFAWFMNAQGESVVPLVDAEGPFAWRSATQPSPGFLRYTLAGYSQQPGLDPNKFYNTGFAIYGEVAPAPPIPPQTCGNPGGNPVNSTANDTLDLGGIACAGGGITTENSYAKVFTADQLGGAYSFNCVNFGFTNSGSYLVGEIGVYIDPNGGDPSVADLQLVQSFPVGLYPNDGGPQFVTVSKDGDPICVELSGSETLVVTLSIAPSTDGFASFFGNASTSSPTYLLSASCGVTDFLDLALIGFPNRHWLVQLSGNFGCGDSIPGDLNLDGFVNGADLSILLGAWGTADPIADLDNSGDVNGADLAILLGNWTG